MDLLNAGLWDVSIYNKQSKTYVPCDDFVFEYHKGTGIIDVRLEEDTLLAEGSYKIRLTSLVEGYEAVYKDMTVIVINKPVSAVLSLSGAIDLVNRSRSTLTVKVTPKNTTGKLSAVSIVSTDYYPILTDGDSFTIRLKQFSAAETKKTTISVKLTLEGGTVVNGAVSFTPKQSVPKVVVPKMVTIRKSGENRTAAYNLQAGLADAIEITDIEKVSIPKGLAITEKEGVVFVHLADRNIKPGVYYIKINSYFAGAQVLFGYPKGKPVTSTISVKVTE